MELADKIRAAVKAQVASAGPRYTPQIEPGAPNIQIAELVDPLASLSFDESFRVHIERLIAAVQDEISGGPRVLSGFFEGKVRTPSALCEVLKGLSVASLQDAPAYLKEADVIAGQCSRSLSKRAQKIWREMTELVEPEGGGEDVRARLGKRRQSLEYSYREFQKASDVVSDVVKFLASPSRALLERNIVFVEGAWGTGKTHTLCDIAMSRLGRQLPIYFVLGKNIAGPEEITRGLIAGLSNADLFHHLDGAGKEIGQRALVVVDGINEGDKGKWFEGIHDLLELAKEHPNVGLVLSVRSPFQHSCVPELLYDRQIKLIHNGFEDAEFDAQKEFFNFYNLNLPEVPILRDEFSRPLVLKIVCEQLTNMTAEQARADFVGITSGQMGMTYIFEGFVKKVGGRLEQANGLSAKFCWKVIKEFRVDRNVVVGLAKSMAERSTDYVSYGEAVEIFFATGEFLSRELAADFLRLMVNEGLLIEGVHSTGYGADFHELPIIQLPYQKFSDHIIARWLLRNHLDPRSEEHLKRCFYANRPLGKIFLIKDKIWPNEYAEPGLAEALMIEFPTRLKGAEFDNKRELIFYLPKDRRLVTPSYSPFLEGLYWRRPMGFGNDTDSILRQLLSSKEDISHPTLDILMVLALKPNHPFGFKRLHRYLSDMGMADRDKFWGEYLRKAYAEQSPWRLLEWLSKAECGKIPEDYAPGLFNVLGWMLVAVNRYQRDVATRSLVELGLVFPRQLFKRSYHSLGSNDPYIPERMLAACYGVTMLKWHQGDVAFSRDLGTFGRLLYRNMFRSGATHKTHHVLMREYALGVIALAHKFGPRPFNAHELADMSPPYATLANPFPDSADIAQEACDSVEDAIRMDFGNYTVGRLIDGRANYDEDHDEYKAVLRQIQWRMADLGYNSREFDSIERRDYYGRQNDEASKIDRYGKKYSWIAYFEMFGLRQAHGLLADYRQCRRTSDCDIDPTFIIGPVSENINIPNVFDAPMSLEDWLADYEFPDLARTLIAQLEGEDWVVIDAHFTSDAVADDRSYWLNVRAFVVDDKDVDSFKSILANDIRLDELAGAPDYYYTYFGETPWAAAIEVNNLCLLEPCPDPQLSKRFTRSEYVEDACAQPVPVPRIKIGNRVFREAGHVSPGKWIETGGVKCARLVYHYSWESYHSRCNNVSGVPFLATAIANQLGLGLRSRAPELIDGSGRPATKPIEIDIFAKYPSSKALLLRRDLAEALTADGKTIMFLCVGEKDIKIDSSFREREQHSPKYPHHVCEIMNSDQSNIYQLHSFKGGVLSPISLE